MALALRCRPPTPSHSCTRWTTSPSLLSRRPRRTRRRDRRLRRRLILHLWLRWYCAATPPRAPTRCGTPSRGDTRVERGSSGCRGTRQALRGTTSGQRVRRWRRSSFRRNAVVACRHRCQCRLPRPRRYRHRRCLRHRLRHRRPRRYRRRLRLRPRRYRRRHYLRPRRRCLRPRRRPRRRRRHCHRPRHSRTLRRRPSQPRLRRPIGAQSPRAPRTFGRRTLVGTRAEIASRGSSAITGRPSWMRASGWVG
mmetsp:Transcript_24661/g.77480  ORF Transcript_24661/g.77480 Transcript_24661/m.77480 type:complete len:251 (+) Transcript_24661:1325-2077(+)